jgi:hypothetical protein
LAIPSIQTYLKNEINRNLQKLLSNSYIVREVVLGELDEDTAQSFINTFCTDEGHAGTEIPITFTYQFDKTAPQAQILIQFKGGTELDEKEGNSLGTVMGTHDQAQGDVLVEKVKATVDTSGDKPQVYLQVTNPIESLVQVQYFQGNYQLNNNRIYIPYMPQIDYSNFESKVTYIPQRVDFQGKKYTHNQTIAFGMDVQENYTIDCLSNSLDTLRCLDALLKVIFIYMRRNPDEQTEYRLAKLQFNGEDLLSQLSNETDSTYGNQTYYRRTEISYLVTYSVDSTVGREINKLLVNLNGGDFQDVKPSQ